MQQLISKNNSKNVIKLFSKLFMKNHKLFLCFVFIFNTFFSAIAVGQSVNQNSSAVLTKEQRDKLTPEQILQQFKDGNERFRTNHSTARDHSEQIRLAAVGQYPKAVVLSCVDSRVPVEDVFDQGLGNVFVARVAGNFANEDILGSMEFACKVAGAKLILVMGHQHCGAIKGAIDDVKLGNLTSLLSKIKPAVEMCQNYKGEKTSHNEAFVKTVAETNVRNTINTIRSKSPILKEMEEKGEIKIVGAFYTLTKGELIFLNQ
jgi:carbonic anhydrase